MKKIGSIASLALPGGGWQSAGRLRHDAVRHHPEVITFPQARTYAAVGVRQELELW